MLPSPQSISMLFGLDDVNIKTPKWHTKPIIAKKNNDKQDNKIYSFAKHHDNKHQYNRMCADLAGVNELCDSEHERK